DLHYRLRVVPIHIPPLRERTEDIPVLAEQFLKEFWAQHREPGSPLPTISRGAMDVLMRAPWPGNVRELRNVIEHLVVMTPAGHEVRPDDILFVDEHDPESSSNAPFGADILSLDYHQARDRVLARFEVE